MLARMNLAIAATDEGDGQGEWDVNARDEVGSKAAKLLLDEVVGE